MTPSWVRRRTHKSAKVRLSGTGLSPPPSFLSSLPPLHRAARLRDPGRPCAGGSAARDGMVKYVKDNGPVTERSWRSLLFARREPAVGVTAGTAGVPKRTHK